MKLDLQSLFGLHVTWCAQLYSFADHTAPPIPCIWTHSYTRWLLVSQNRRHLFVTPLLIGSKVATFHGSSAFMEHTVRWREGRGQELYSVMDDSAICPETSTIFQPGAHSTLFTCICNISLLKRPSGQIWSSRPSKKIIHPAALSFKRPFWLFERFVLGKHFSRQNHPVSPRTDKKETKFSSYIRKYRWDRWQSHMWGRTS